MQPQCRRNNVFCHSRTGSDLFVSGWSIPKRRNYLRPWASLTGSGPEQLPHLQAQLPIDSQQKFMREPEGVTILISWSRRETNRWMIPHSWPARLLEHHAGFLEVSQAMSSHLTWQQVSPLSETYATACSNAWSLMHWVRPGIKLTSSWILNFLGHNRNPHTSIFKQIQWGLFPF